MIFRKILIHGGSIYGTCLNEAGGVWSSSLMFDIVIIVSNIWKLVLVDISDSGINRQCLRCHPICKCSFKFGILLWYFWWINNCAFDIDHLSIQSPINPCPKSLGRWNNQTNKMETYVGNQGSRRVIPRKEGLHSYSTQVWSPQESGKVIYYSMAETLK